MEVKGSGTAKKGNIINNGKCNSGDKKEKVQEFGWLTEDF